MRLINDMLEEAKELDIGLARWRRIPKVTYGTTLHLYTLAGE